MKPVRIRTGLPLYLHGRVGNSETLFQRRRHENVNRLRLCALSQLDMHRETGVVATE